MSRRIVWSQRAEREARRLDDRMRERVARALDRLAETELGDVRKLQGRGDERRLRVGDWRILFAYGDDGNTIYVLRVLLRGRAYRD